MKMQASVFLSAGNLYSDKVPFQPLIDFLTKRDSGVVVCLATHDRNQSFFTWLVNKFLAQNQVGYGYVGLPEEGTSAMLRQDSPTVITLSHDRRLVFTSDPAHVMTPQTVLFVVDQASLPALGVEEQMHARVGKKKGVVVVPAGSWPYGGTYRSNEPFGRPCCGRILSSAGGTVGVDHFCETCHLTWSIEIGDGYAAWGYTS